MNNTTLHYDHPKQSQNNESLFVCAFFNKR